MVKRSHVLISEEITREIDKVAGDRQRSKFIAEAVREKLNRVKLIKAIDKTAGVISAERYPEWETEADVARWVRHLRKEDEKTLKKKMKKR